MNTIHHPYTTSLYVDSLNHIGKTYLVPEWETSVLIRKINNHFEDIFGPYPLTILPKNCNIQGGLQRLRNSGFVSATLILDDFHRPDLNQLQDAFTIVTPFKTHLITNLQTTNHNYTKHHRYYIKKALEKVTVKKFDLEKYLTEWGQLYQELATKHNLSSLHKFSAAHHHALSQLPGVTAIGAWIEDKLVSAHIFVSDGNYVHSHLAASNQEGYSCGAAYAINDAAIKFFKDTKLINFGGGAGLSSQINDGLFKFKQGFANDQSQSYLCGVILDPKKYEDLTNRKEPTTFFPAYRFQL